MPRRPHRELTPAGAVCYGPAHTMTPDPNAPPQPAPQPSILAPHLPPVTADEILTIALYVIRGILAVRGAQPPTP